MLRVVGSIPIPLTLIKMNYKCKGTLYYYPKWLIIIIDGDIAEYYRRLVYLSNKRLNLQHPKHGAHITVISGKYEDVSKHSCWNKYERKEIEFNYSIDIGTDGRYYWLPVECQRIEEIRIELGLPPKIPIPWHLTIGNLK